MVYHYRCLTFGGFVRLGNKQVKQPTHPSNQLHLALILTRPNGEDTLRRPHAHLNVNEIDIVGWLVGWLVDITCTIVVDVYFRSKLPPCPTIQPFFFRFWFVHIQWRHKFVHEPVGRIIAILECNTNKSSLHLWTISIEHVCLSCSVPFRLFPMFGQ